MGLSNFPSAAEGVLPVLVINTVLSVALLKNMFRSILHLLGAAASSSSSSSSFSSNPNTEAEADSDSDGGRKRRISITRYRSLSRSRSGRDWGMVECCVCLCGFQGSEEVSELSCKHFFHKACLEKWFRNRQYSTCPLCRSID
ncbi:putative E3 ubiquitin-protein ligase XERICO [Senna tora]|uniref:Putative E3 ubiquitin-protein ligase XERICO n=1 Tax=Senna tora TaxID=362788 RepID=A0A834WXV2_9FABA|nr:putative E3 ubiquitin-protein ligase XERICO [Senna tora]